MWALLSLRSSLGEVPEESGCQATEGKRADSKQVGREAWQGQGVLLRTGAGREDPAQVGREVRLLEEGGTDWKGEGIWAQWWRIFGSPRPLGSWQYGFKSEASLDATRPFVRKGLGVYLSRQNTCLMRVKPRVGSAAPHRAGHGGSCLCPKPWGDGVRKMRNQRSSMAA